MRTIARILFLSCCSLTLACSNDPLGNGNSTADSAGTIDSSTTPDLAAGCAGLDEKSCQANPACEGNYCGCNPPGLAFSGCYAKGQLPPCDPIPCARPECKAFADAKSCDGSGFCHSVYLDEDDMAYGGTGCTRDCASPSCCTDFNRCVDGAKADCKGPALCNRVQPRCFAPYLVSYQGQCYEGCVLQAECQ